MHSMCVQSLHVDDCSLVALFSTNHGLHARALAQWDLPYLLFKPCRSRLPLYTPWVVERRAIAAVGCRFDVACRDGSCQSKLE